MPAERVSHNYHVCNIVNVDTGGPWTMSLIAMLQCHTDSYKYIVSLIEAPALPNNDLFLFISYCTIQLGD